VKRTGLLVTGIDTGVGKTYIAASLARWFSSKGIDVGVMKPVESGCEVAAVASEEAGERLLPSDALALMKAAGVTDPLDTVNPYRFAKPVSPNIAARLSGTTVELEVIIDRYKILANAHDAILVEGAGGFLTPLSDTSTVADLAVLLKLPVLIVAASRLGCINATLLTVEAVQARGLKVAGVLLNNPVPLKTSDKSHAHNHAEIRRFSSAPVLGSIQFNGSETVQEFGDSIDLSGLLAPDTSGA
jgi:dethiobiotin synthetase